MKISQTGVLRIIKSIILIAFLYKYMHRYMIHIPYTATYTWYMYHISYTCTRYMYICIWYHTKISYHIHVWYVYAVTYIFLSCMIMKSSTLNWRYNDKYVTYTFQEISLSSAARGMTNRLIQNIPQLSTYLSCRTSNSKTHIREKQR